MNVRRLLIGRKLTRIKIMKDKIKTYKKVFKIRCKGNKFNSLTCFFIIENTCLLIAKKVNPCDLLRETRRDATMSRIN